MLEKPDIPEVLLSEQVREYYGVDARRIAFLPLGNDQNSAVYRVEDRDSAAYFLKVRLGDFDDASATLPKLLSDQGVRGVIAPIENKYRCVWTSVERYNLVLYPFVDGHTGFDAELTDQNWIDLGQALRAIHKTTVPPKIEKSLRREAFSSRWRDGVRELLTREIRPVDTATEKLADFLATRREHIVGLVERAEALTPLARYDESDFVLCHGDIHGRNVLIDSSGALYVVDWDTAVLAPRERDLMFIGGGVGGIWKDEREAALFYEGYGPVTIDSALIAYYRFDRIVEDIVVTTEQILSKDFGDKDREKWVGGLERQFLPRDVVEMARRADEALSRR